MRENADQNNTKYGHISRSASCQHFTVELENTIVPSLHEDSSFWKQYDDDIYVMPAQFGTIFTISKTISHGGLTFSKNWDH